MPEPAHAEEPLAGEGAERARGTHPSLPRLPLPATVDTVPDGTRVSVIVRGELDLETGERLRPDLLHALSGSTEGIDLHLSEVTFCDCSGTNLLLDLRRLALRDGKTMAVLSTSTAVERIFDLTATHDLFVPPELSAPPAPEGEKETRLHHQAENVAGTAQGTDLREAVQKQLAAAVAKANKANRVNRADEVNNASQPGPPIASSPGSTNAASQPPNVPPTPDHA